MLSAPQRGAEQGSPLFRLLYVENKAKGDCGGASHVERRIDGVFVKALETSRANSADVAGVGSNFP